MKKKTMKKKETKQPKTKKSTIILVVVFIILVLAVGGGLTFVYFNYADNMKAAAPGSTVTVIFTIEPGDTIKTVAKRLQQENMIRSASVFELSARKNNRYNIQAGNYEISAGMSSGQILKILSDPSKAIQENIVSVVIKEGLWAKDVAKAIAEKCDISAEALIALWNDPAYISELNEKYWFISLGIIQKGQRVILEGYLYPDTYYFYKDADAKAITEKILDNFDAKIGPLEDEIAAFPYSVQQVVTLASIVQLETGNYADMPVVAGIFMNRLKKPMKLQSSVSVCYMLYDYKSPAECELVKNQKLNSPYNTYVIDGLPLGPITNPTYQAIKAVINYSQTEYFYFIGKDGVTYFAKTYEEHQRNIDKYLR